MPSQKRYAMIEYIYILRCDYYFFFLTWKCGSAHEHWIEAEFCGEWFLYLYRISSYNQHVYHGQNKFQGYIMWKLLKYYF